jgi:hypothetical protein
MGERRCKHRVYVGKLEEKRILGKIGVGVRIILKRIVKKYSGRA